MTAQKAIEPYRIHKPIQLLAAWLLGLITIDSVFLTTVIYLGASNWLSTVLVIAAIVNVPIFIICLFILQTKFRPEMQEDIYYTKYLEYLQQTRTPPDINKELNSLKESVSNINSDLFKIIGNIQSQISDIIGRVEPSQAENGTIITEKDEMLISKATKSQASIDNAIKEAEWKMIRVSINDLLTNYNEVFSRFKSAGIVFSDTFGSNSDPPEQPTLFTLSFGSNVPAKNIQKILELLSDLGLQAINYINNDMSKGKVYIGSYGYKHFNHAMLNGELLQKLLDDKLSTEEFIGLVVTNSKVIPRFPINT